MPWHHRHRHRPDYFNVSPPPPRPVNEFPPYSQPAPIPPPPGPTPTGPYEYLVVPYISQRSFCHDGRIPDMKLIYWFIESYQSQTRAPMDRVDLADKTRVYRTLTQFLWRFTHDINGAWIWTPKGKYRFQVDDPTIGQAMINVWTPAGL